MFRVENNVPDVYIQQSRDFQLVSRLYDLVIQSARFEIDSMQRISRTETCNNTVLPLLATKVGFFSNYNISEGTFRKILSAFPYVLKQKGSLYSIILIKNLFERIYNTNIDIDISEVDSKNIITFEFYTYGVDYELFTTLLNYVKPTGLLFNYKIRIDIDTDSDYAVTDSINVINMPETRTSGVPLSGIVVQHTTNGEEYNSYSSKVGFTQVYDNKNTEKETQE